VRTYVLKQQALWHKLSVKCYSSVW